MHSIEVEINHYDYLPLFAIVFHFMKTSDDILFDCMWRDFNLDTKQRWHHVKL